MVEHHKETDPWSVERNAPHKTKLHELLKPRWLIIRTHVIQDSAVVAFQFVDVGVLYEQ
jgi:hypothetical protein